MNASVPIILVGAALIGPPASSQGGPRAAAPASAGLLPRGTEAVARDAPVRSAARVPFAADASGGPHPLRPRYGVRLGGVFAMVGAGATLQGASFSAQFDAERFFVDVTAELYAGEATHLAAVGTGAYLPLAQGDMAPYVGGGLKLASTRFGGKSACSPVPFAGAGVVLGRAGQVVARAELDWLQALGANDGGGGAGGPLLSFGLGF